MLNTYVFFLNFSRSSRARAGPFPLFKGPGLAHMGPYGPIWHDRNQSFTQFLDVSSPKLCFWASPRKTMQNRYQITSKTKLWTRSVRNWTKTCPYGPGPGPWRERGPGPGPWRAGKVQEKLILFYITRFYQKSSLTYILCFLMVLLCSSDFWPKYAWERL